MSSQDLTSIVTPQLLIAIGGSVPAAKRGAQAAHAAVLAERLPPLLRKFNIDTPLRLAHLLSQLAHESDSFCTVEEYASGAAYEGRADLGNTQRGDGKRFKGRGPIQLTGRDNYGRFTAWVRGHVPSAPDFEAHPELVFADAWVAWSVVYYWVSRNINQAADKDDIIHVTRIINGGRNGLADRKVMLARAKEHIARFLALRADRNADLPTLSRGLLDSIDVEILQTKLRAQGFKIAIDGDFGPATELAVQMFQSRVGLPPTGIADDATWTHLK